MKTMNDIPNSQSNLSSATAPALTPWIDRMPRPSRTPDPRAMLHHADVVAGIEGTLVKCGVDPQDLPDGVAEVQCRTVKSLNGKAVPTTVEQWRALCCTVAKRMVITDRRREERRGRWHAGLCEKPDEVTPTEPEPWRRDLAETRELLAVLKAQFDAGEMPEHGQEILQHTADGWTARRIGKELGISESAVKNRLMRMRAKFARKLASLGMVVTMLLLAVFFALPFGGGGVGQGRPPETAESLRHDALEACDAARWRTCLDELDEARAMDPAGDDDPAIRTMRERAERGLAEEPQNGESTPRP